MLKDYVELCKPRVILLITLCALIGMIMATDKTTTTPWLIITLASIGIALIASGAAVINQVYDQEKDAKMAN